MKRVVMLATLFYIRYFSPKLCCMKIPLLVFLFTISLASISQKTEAYYDFFWEPCAPESARYFSTLEKTDSGWLRHDYYVSTGKLQMRALYEDQACKTLNGNSYFFYANGNPSAVGRSLHGKQEGICLSYHANGMMSDSGMFHNG